MDYAQIVKLYGVEADHRHSPANPYTRTPAMAANASDHVWKIEEIVALLG